MNLKKLEPANDNNSHALFKPKFTCFNQTNSTQIDNQILNLYAKGLGTRDIIDSVKEMYDTDVSTQRISNVTARILDQVLDWQSRPLQALYPIVTLDSIVLQIRHNNQIIDKSMCLALGVNLEGRKELLGLWLAQAESGEFWLSALSELKHRGLHNILITCTGGLTSLADAVEVVFPHTKIQRCFAHLVHKSLKQVAWEDHKQVTNGLGRIYQSATEAKARQELERFAETWDVLYPTVSQSWRYHWDSLVMLFDYPPAIRKAINTTNTFDLLHNVIHKTLKRRKLFPNDESAIKVVYLALQSTQKKWSMPPRCWKAALHRFKSEFSNSVSDYLDQF